MHSAAIRRLQRLGGDDLARRIIDHYLEGAPVRIDALRKGTDEGDLDTVEREAHSLRSSAGNVGADPVGEIAGRIEQLAAEGQMRGLAKLIEDLGHAIDRSTEELEAKREELGSR